MVDAVVKHAVVVDDMLEALVDGPGDGGAGHLVHHTRLQALKQQRKNAAPVRLSSALYRILINYVLGIVL